MKTKKARYEDRDIREVRSEGDSYAQQVAAARKNAARIETLYDLPSGCIEWRYCVGHGFKFYHGEKEYHAPST